MKSKTLFIYQNATSKLGNDENLHISEIRYWSFILLVTLKVRAATNESQKTRNKKQNGLAHLRFLVCVTPKQKRTLLDSRIKFLAKHV